ncbi:hypothetical protein [Leadbetterella byssophila]|uniref:hypothetical protein n=1 Tax=Leadbetterella byssophila TaxID=316068 RepID=UPI0039A065CE
MSKKIIDLIQSQKAFDAFVNENMKTSTYKIGWDKEMSVEYEASKAFQAYTADYAAAMLGTVIDKHASRPKRDMPSIGDITGTLARLGDEWQIDNDRLEKYFLMERRFREKAATYSETKQKEEYAKIVKYLFNPYELAAIAPHRRILANYWEGLSDGQITVNVTNNKDGVVWSAPISTGINKSILRNNDVLWDAANLATMDVLSVLRYLSDKAEEAGKTVQKFRVSRATSALICQSKMLKDLIGLNIGKIKTDSSPALGIDIVNQYLVAVDLAPIEVVKEKGVLSDGTAISMFKDGRVVAQCADKVAVLKVSDPLEAEDPIPNKVYTTYHDNLISQWRNDNGRYVAYEMWAFPVFTGRNDVFILDVTQKES